MAHVLPHGGLLAKLRTTVRGGRRERKARGSHHAGPCFFVQTIIARPNPFDANIGSTVFEDPFVDIENGSAVSRVGTGDQRGT